MSALKYTIPEISAYSILSAAVETKNGYRFSFDATDPSRSYMVENTKQDDCPIFFQAMRILGYNEKDLDASEKLRDVFVFIDFSGIFDRKPVGKVLVAQKKAEYMFRPEGINIFFGKQEYRYIAFERSASMSRQSRLSFVREDIYEALRERMMLGMTIGQCQLSKLYAYNALLFTDGRRYRNESLLSAEHIVVIDNPKSIVKNASVITVEDDGTDNPVRKYHRVEKTADIEITEFDGEGLVSAELARKIDIAENHPHHSFQIRLPYIKGVVHEVDFKNLFAELGVSEITDIWGNRHRVSDVELIINKSMFKGFGWMTENGLSFAEYLDRCCKYDHALYISGTDKAGVQKTTELNYQFLNTLAITEEEFRPKDLPLGWTHTPEWDRRQWITKTTETEYFSLIGDHGSRRDYFIADLEREDLGITVRRRIRAELVKKNGLWVDEPIYAKELEDKAEQILSKYGVGQLLVAGDNRYLSDDLMRLLSYIVRTSGGDSAVLDAECLSGNTVYAPMPGYAENGTYTLLRSPHIARNEEALVKPLENVGAFRQKYLSHLHYILMVDSRSLIPERLGGADFDGDMIKTVADPLLNRCVQRNYTDGSYLPLLKIPTAEPLLSDANDWYARFLTVKSTFSSRVGQISNAALRSGIIAYDENTSVVEQDACRKETEIMAILTGLEIDSAKSGIKPDLSEYLGIRKGRKSLFLRYKSIVGDDDNNRKWYQPTVNARLKKYFAGVDWESISSNLEKLPYYAYMLDKNTQKCGAEPVKDDGLFDFVFEPGWKEKRDPKMMERMVSVIADYEEALRRVRYLHHAPESMKRKNDVERILFARGQENDYTVDELYAAFDRASADKIRRSRLLLSERQWHLTPPEERENVLAEILPGMYGYEYAELFCDFRCSGYRVLGDIICDMDDLHRSRQIQKNLFAQKGDSKDLVFMLGGIAKFRDYKEEIARRCVMTLQPPTARNRFDFEEAAKCAIALGKRQFALEVLPASVLELTCDRSHVFEPPAEEKPKKRRLRHK